MRKDDTQTTVQSVKGDVVAVRELIEQPEHAVHFDPLCKSEFPQTSIAGEQCPLSGLSDGESKSVRGRKARVLAPNSGRPGKL